MPRALDVSKLKRKLGLRGAMDYLEADRAEKKASFAQWYAKQPKTIFAERTQRRMRKFPWLNSYRAARERCCSPRSASYKYYGGRGVQFLLTIEDVRRLWERDKAHKLDWPSIDRIDRDGHYVYENCRFIERLQNTRRKATECPISQISNKS